jgi:hypothetical protein
VHLDLDLDLDEEVARVASFVKASKEKKTRIKKKNLFRLTQLILTLG